MKHQATQASRHLLTLLLLTLLAFIQQAALAAEPLPGPLAVPDSLGQRVFLANPATNEVTIIASNSVGTGPSVGEMWAAVADGPQRVWAADFTNGRLILINAITKVRATAANVPYISNVAIGPDGMIYMVGNNAGGNSVRDAIYSYNPFTGALQLVSGYGYGSLGFLTNRGSGPDMDSIRDLTVSPDGKKLIVADGFEGALNSTPSYVLEIDISTGSRTEVDRFGAVIDHPRAVEYLNADTVLVLDSPALFQLDLRTKTATILSKSGTGAVGSGPAFQSEDTMAYYQGSNFVYVSGGTGGAIKTVALANGDRATLGVPAQWTLMGQIGTSRDWSDLAPVLTPQSSTQYRLDFKTAIGGRFEIFASSDNSTFSSIGSLVADAGAEAVVLNTGTNRRAFFKVVRTQ
jgi:hypothetical protein